MQRLRALCLTAVFALGACGDAAKAPATKAEPAKTAASAAPTQPPSDLPGAEDLLADVVEAMGGAAKFDAIKSHASEIDVEVVDTALSGSGKGWWKEGDFYQEVAMPGVGMMQIGRQGGKIWLRDPIQGLRDVTGKEAAMYEASSSINLAHDWRRYFDTAKTVAVEEVGGKKFAEVLLSSTSTGLELGMRIDLTDRRIVMRRVKQPGPMGEVPIEETLKDYRQQDGLWFSFQQVADMKLQKMRTTVKKLDLNVPVDETKFAKPGSEALAAPLEPGRVEPDPNAKKPEDPKKRGADTKTSADGNKNIDTRSPAKKAD